MMIQSITIMLAYVIDRYVGDPPKWPHPVKFFGRYINFCEKHFNKRHFKKIAGFFSLLGLIISLFFITVYLLIYLYHIHFLLGLLVEAILIATTIASKGLKDAALAVYYPLKKNDLHQARSNLSEIVGRDTDDLLESEIVRGTVETVAENTTDGITAPLFWAFIGGAPLALVYRAINTCDSVVGYKTPELKDFGWASARLDDIVNFLPARITGMLMLLTHKQHQNSLKKAYKALFIEAKKHNSPNSGWNEAAVAIILGVQLGGINKYKGKYSKAPLLGTLSRHLETEDITKTIKIMQGTTVLFITGGVFIVFTLTWF